MAAGAQAQPGTVTSISIPVGGSAGVGTVAVVPPTFLEKWGVVFVSVAGIWMLLVAGALMNFYLHHLQLAPLQSQMSADEYTKVLNLHKTAGDQFRDSLSFIFDLLVTKTVLPLVTLLLGYLFGSKKT